MDWSKESNNSVACAYAEIVKVTNKMQSDLDLYNETRKSVEFEFLMRFDKKFKKEHDFLLPKVN